jgi:hypothetical protein
VQKKIRCWTCPRLPSDQVTWICCRQSNQDDGFIIGICGQCHVGRSLLTWASTWHWIYTASIYIYIYIYRFLLFFFGIDFLDGHLCLYYMCLVNNSWACWCPVLLIPKVFGSRGLETQFIALWLPFEEEHGCIMSIS